MPENMRWWRISYIACWLLWGGLVATFAIHYPKIESGMQFIAMLIGPPSLGAMLVLLIFMREMFWYPASEFEPD